MIPHDLSAALKRVGAQFIVRGWLSANNIVFQGSCSVRTAVVDTGYASHAQQTLQLVETALSGHDLNHIVNTHLHSDHCGGNQALQERFPGARTTVPAGFSPAVVPWDETRLTFRDTGQYCPPFRVDEFVNAGEVIHLGDRAWEVHAAPGHDPDALMFYEPLERLLISGDALWERRLAIIFPELAGTPGFKTTRRTLDAIERLEPRWVLPGHGHAFNDVAEAVRRSRERLEQFEAHPSRHREHAARALAMFHMLEVQATSRQELEDWMADTPIFERTLSGRALSSNQGARAGGSVQPQPALAAAAREVIESLLEDKVLRCSGNILTLASN